MLTSVGEFTDLVRICGLKDAKDILRSEMETRRSLIKASKKLGKEGGCRVIVTPIYGTTDVKEDDIVDILDTTEEKFEELTKEQKAESYKKARKMILGVNKDIRKNYKKLNKMIKGMEKVKLHIPDYIDADEIEDTIPGIKDFLMPILDANGDPIIIDETHAPYITDAALSRIINDGIGNISAMPENVRCTITTFMFIANKISMEQLLRFTDTSNVLEIQFINSIYTAYYSWPLYKDVPVCDLASCYDNDPSQLARIISWLNNNDEIAQISDNNIKKTFNKFNEIITKYIGKPDEMIINSNLMDFDNARNVSKNMGQKLNIEFGDILEGYHDYKFVKEGDIACIYITRPDLRVDQYYIDPGIILGNGYNLMMPQGTSWFFISSKHKDIIKKCFDNPMYRLDFDEVTRVYKDVFTNLEVYMLVDMSKGPEFLPRLSGEDFNILGKKLSFIYNLTPYLAGTPLELGRIRFKSFKSVDDFVLVSDNKCKSAFVGYNIDYINNGLTIKVKDLNVEVSNPSIEGVRPQKFTINEFGAM